MFLEENLADTIRCSYYAVRLLTALIELWTKVRSLRAMPVPKPSRSSSATGRRRR